MVVPLLAMVWTILVLTILAMAVPLFFLMRTQKQGDEQEVPVAVAACHLRQRGLTALPCHCRRRTRRLR